MNKTATHAIAVAIGLAFSAAATAQYMTKADYKSAKDAIAADYKSAQAACAAMSGAEKDACSADARNNRETASADLKTRYSSAKAPQETTGGYVEDSVITTKVKAAVLGDASLKSAEINVETFKGIVQLSGFVRSQTDINRAVQVARGIKGVASVKNVMVVKGQQ